MCAFAHSTAMLKAKGSGWECETRIAIHPTQKVLVHSYACGAVPQLLTQLMHVDFWNTEKKERSSCSNQILSQEPLVKCSGLSSFMPILSRSKSYFFVSPTSSMTTFPTSTLILPHILVYIQRLAKEPFIRDVLPGNMKHLPLAGDVESQPAKAPVWTGCSLRWHCSIKGGFWKGP